MLFRFFIILTLFISTLFAEPSMGQIKQALSANPALLNTPQAKAAMAEKGVTAAEVKQKLNETNSDVSSTEPPSETIENNIDTTVEDIDNNETATDRKDNSLVKRVNPFVYKTNDELRRELNLKQQVLISQKLTRYSSNFYANKNTINSSSLPTPPDYIVSTGDSLNVHIYGDREKNHTLKVQKDGSVELEFIGPVKIAGMKFKDAKNRLEARLKAHFSNSDFNITMGKYSTIQVTLIGEVKFPGIYNLSSFSTAKDLLIAAKGVTKNASVRKIQIKRNFKVIAELDFYDLLFKGNEFAPTILKHGDVVVISKAKKLVSIDGYISHAAIFELSKYENLDQLIEYAGGMKPNASKLNIKIDRYSNNSTFETYKVDYKNAKNFKMQDGDKVYVYSLDFTAKKSINVYGNIIRPGSYRINKNESLNSFFKRVLKNGSQQFFLPETYFEYGIVKRYTQNLTYATKSFSINKILNDQETLLLHPGDKLFIFSQNDIYSNSYITTKGTSLVRAGKLQYFEGITIQDAINASGIDGLLDDKVRLTTYDTPDFMPKTLFYSLKDEGSVLLKPYDEVEVYDYYSTHILEPVSISGEVVNKVSVFYEKGMTLENLINIAGGLTKRAYKHNVEIVRYFVDENQIRQRRIISIDTENISLSSVALEPYDEVKIFKIPKWSEKKSIVLRGEVVFPGTYTISSGEKLSDVIKRAGGFTQEAFVEGAVFTRESIRKKQNAQYEKSLARIKRELAIINAMPANAKKQAGVAQASSSLDEVMIEAKKYIPIGRVSIKLDENLTIFEESAYNLVLKNQDSITVPSQIDTVTVFGEVFNPTSFVYDGESYLEDYIAMASGYTRNADDESVYVIHADGTSEPISTGWFSADLQIKKGDTIVVPIYIKENNTLDVWDSISKILASFALTAAAINSLGII